MSFQFRLEKVLKHRKSLEEIAKRDFIHAQNDLKVEQELLQNYFHFIELAQAKRHELIIQGNSPGDSLSQIFEYIKGMEIKINRQKDVISKNLAIVEEKKLALQEAAREYKMIEKLREKQQIEYRIKEKKLEEKLQNEIANSKSSSVAISKVILGTGVRLKNES